MKSFVFFSTDTVQTVVTNFECLRLIFFNHLIVIGQILTVQRGVRINWLHFEWPSTRKNKIPSQTRYNLSREPNDFRKTATGKLIYTAASFASKVIRMGMRVFVAKHRLTSIERRRRPYRRNAQRRWCRSRPQA